MRVLCLSVIVLTLMFVTSYPRYAVTCEGSPSLVDKFDTLLTKHKAKLNDSLKVFEDFRAAYYEQISQFNESRISWLNSSPSTADFDKQKEMLHLGAGLLQKAIETYSLWNDGLYPENPDALMCPDLKLLAGFYENPFETGESLNVSISKPSDGNFVYIPDYEDGTNNSPIIGFWLIILGNEYINDSSASGKLLKPLPGNVILPTNTFVVLETH